MPRFSRHSREQLETVHPHLQRLLNEAIRYMDFKVLEGHRSEEKQNAAFRKGLSKVQYPNSKHNSFPARAVDLAPWPIDWKDVRRFDLLAGFLLGLATARGIKLRWGGDWDRDFDPRDQTFHDLGHFELMP